MHNSLLRIAKKEKLELCMVLSPMLVVFEDPLGGVHSPTTHRYHLYIEQDGSFDHVGSEDSIHALFKYAEYYVADVFWDD